MESSIPGFGKCVRSKDLEKLRPHEVLLLGSRLERSEGVRIIAIVNDHVVARPDESAVFESTESGHTPTIAASGVGE